MSLRWKVEKIHDKGPQEHYRFHVQGWIEDPPHAPRYFSWGVPSVTDNPAWDLSGAVDVDGRGNPLEATP